SSTKGPKKPLGWYICRNNTGTDNEGSCLMAETLQTAPEAQPNPLLAPWQTPFETPPFDAIRPEHFLPAFERAFADHSAESAAITQDPSAPDFANTITALERA